eukprot:212142-Hanusia_phi.AAC.2
MQTERTAGMGIRKSLHQDECSGSDPCKHRRLYKSEAAKSSSRERRRLIGVRGRREEIEGKGSRRGE